LPLHSKVLKHELIAETGGHESDQEDDELENWEAQQIRKAVTGAQVRNNNFGNLRDMGAGISFIYCK
jgi:hypothetical protein